MSEKTSYAPGTPSWVDLASPDVEAAAAFYGPLLGWTTTSPGADEQTGGYRMFELRGTPVAGVAPIMTAGHPPSWTTYISVADADETIDKVRDAGGSVIVEPMDIMTVGRMAAFADPTGAITAIWQPRDHIGAGIVNEPGSLCWNELACRNPEAAKAFYGAVFGWEAVDGAPGGQPYTTWRSGGADVGGMIVMDARWPGDVPAHWMTYFAVDDADRAAEWAKAHGGTVTVEPFDIPVGRLAVLADPHGAPFSVITMN